ncbi:MAG: GNAT family N-acetyltransferase [Bifidobacteriaceae bacterium]|nr:GNAT family N-acetyltransferase [Bifidobacteriaceae bacterium]
MGGLTTERHDTAEFDSGEPSLDTWLREHAAPAAKRGTALTWVWTDSNGRVVAYYSLAAHKVARGDVPARLGRGGPAEVAAILLAKLALTRGHQGRGLGSVLAFDALERVAAATEQVAARFVVVEAISERAASFYQRLWFRRVPASMLLVQKTADIATAIAQVLKKDVGNVPRCGHGG